MNCRTVLVVQALAMALFAACVYSQQKPVEPATAIQSPTVGAEPLTVPKPVQENLGAVVSLKVDDFIIVPTVASTMQVAQQAFSKIAQGSSSGGGGGNYWQYATDTKSESITGLYGDPYTRDQPPVLTLHYVQRKPDGWRLQVSAEEKGDIGIQIFNKAHSYLFRVDQDSTGQIRVVQIDDNGIVAASSNSFVELMDHHPKICNEVLLPTLRRWGISKIHGKFSIDMRDVFLRQFDATTDDSIVEFESQIGFLNSGSFAERESASKWVLENAKSILPLIMQCSHDSETPPEVRGRLLKILEASLPDDEFEFYKVGQQQRLIEDPEFLVWLMSCTEEQSIRSKIGQKLNGLTGQNFADDLEGWNRWLIESGIVKVHDRAPEVSSAPPVLPKHEGPLAQIEPRLDLLIPLEVHQQRLIVNRNRWTEKFGGKTVKDLVAETENFLIDKGLPKSWLTINDPQILATLDYPQIIFKRIEDKFSDDPQDPAAKLRIQQQRAWAGQQNPSRNADFRSLALAGRLEVDEGVLNYRNLGSIRNRTQNSEDVLIVHFSEISEPKNAIQIGQWPDQSLRIVVCSGDCIVQIYQSADSKLWLDCAVGEATIHREFQTADELIQDEYFRDSVVDYLDQFGLSIRQDSASPISEKPEE